LLAAAALVLPGLLLGTALRGASDAGRLSPLALGAALGTVLALFVPELLSGGAKPLGETRWTWDVALAGVGLSCLGALAFLSAERGRARVVGIVLALLVAAVPATRPRFGFSRFTPWYPAPIEPDAVLPTPLGILTVEPYVDGSRIVTLDRKRLTPIRSEERVDELRILRALGLMRAVEGRAIRLLVIGQLTPARSEFLKVLGPLDVDYTAPWASAFPAIEDLLFPLDAPPIGRPISPAEAEGRIADGAYDLVLALPVHGPSIAPKSAAWIPWGSVEEPVLDSLDVPEGTTAVAWLDANSPLVRCDLGERVLYVAHRFQRPTIGVVRGSIREDAASEKPAVLAGGDPEPRPEAWELLQILPRERAFALHAALFRRLGHANEDGPEADLARGLAAHYGAQSVSSPFESAGQQIEFDEEEARAFKAAGAEEVLDATTRDVLEDEAWLLTEKRQPDLVLGYLESVAQAHGPWPALDRALARALEELLEPAEALTYYDRALATETDQGSYDLMEFVRASDLAIEVGDYARAIDYARRGIAIQPRKELEMRLCKALRLFGDPAGDELLEKLRPDLTEEELRWLEGSTGPPPEASDDEHVHEDELDETGG
jgi:tetratricopeptide (TPR) repeat protein